MHDFLQCNRPVSPQNLHNGRPGPSSWHRNDLLTPLSHPQTYPLGTEWKAAGALIYFKIYTAY